jgi:CBS domain-containing protein
MATVSQLLAIKGHTVHSIGRTATVYEAIDQMVAHNVGALIVMDATDPCGIITERDYLRKIALQGRASRTTFVQDIMSENLAYVDLDSEIEECMSMMTKRRIRHLPVFDGTQIVGIVSIGDIVRHLASDRKSQIEQLHQYIQGGSPVTYA